MSGCVRSSCLESLELCRNQTEIRAIARAEKRHSASNKVNITLHAAASLRKSECDSDYSPSLGPIATRNFYGEAFPET